MKTIKCKADFYELANKGLCGNTARTWKTLREFLVEASGFGRYGVRYLQKDKKGGLNLSYKDICEKVRFEPEGSFVISESDGISKEELVKGLCGYFSFIGGEYNLYYAEHVGYLKYRLATEGKTARGYSALELLQKTMGREEYEGFMELYWHYAEESCLITTIEFAVMPFVMGRFNRALVVWEIRTGY